MTSAERLEAQRVVAAPADAVFAVVADPARHPDLEPTDWVREAIDARPIGAVGDMFGMDMFHEAAGGQYRMDNRVTVFESGRAIAWEPGQYDEEGVFDPGGWLYRYDLRPQGEATSVTLTYDWSGVPAHLRAEITFPPFGADYLDASLACLARAVGT